MRPYSYLVRAVVALFGFSERVVRLPSAAAYCAFAWGLAVIAWRPGRPRIGGLLASLAPALFFLAAPGARYTAVQARGHMVAAGLIGWGLYLFIEACGRDDGRRKRLLGSVLCAALAAATLPTGVVLFAGIWATILLAHFVRRPVLAADVAWLYVATNVAMLGVALVYAPSLPRTLLWLGRPPSSGPFTLGTILPWTNGPIGLIAVAVTLVFLLRALRPAVWSLPVTILLASALIAAHRHGHFHYWAGAAAASAVACALVMRGGDRLPRLLPVLVAILLWATGLVSLATRPSVRPGPRSLAREVVVSIAAEDRVLLVGHCEAPRFYLERARKGRRSSADNRAHLDALLAGSEFDWIILNGSAAGPPEELVRTGAIPSDRYRLVAVPPPDGERIWAWRNARDWPSSP